MFSCPNYPIFHTKLYQVLALRRSASNASSFPLPDKIRLQFERGTYQPLNKLFIWQPEARLTPYDHSTLV